MRDILPPESALWNRIEQTVRDVFGTFGFAEIRLPIFEQTELFARSVGQETDIVSKEMYVLEDHDLQDLAALRARIQLRDPMVTDLPSYENYLKQLTDFTQGFREALASGNAPRTPDNGSALTRLSGSLDVLKSLVGSQDDLISRPHIDVVRTILSSILLGDRITPRPEATASVVRAYIQNGMQVRPSPVRLYYMGPMFRRERPQKGRYRQFYQIGAEILGSNISDYSVDADLIIMLVTALQRTGLSQFSLSINSIGCKECRQNYADELRVKLQPVKEKLGPDSRRRIERNPLRILDSKVPAEQGIINALPSILDSLCSACKEHFEGVKRTLASREVVFNVNPRLVRGLDYYVRTTFEVTAGGQGAQDAICGGGRYDGLVELIGGTKFSQIDGIGFAIGEDRLVEALKHSHVGASSRTDVVIAWRDLSSREHAQTIATLLRDSELVVEVPVKPMSPGDGLRLANTLGATIGVVVGPNEVNAGVFSLRFLTEGDQVSLSMSQVGHVRLLLKFRVLLERELQQLAITSGVDYKNLSLVALAERLIAGHFLDGSFGTLIKMAAETFNTAIHGKAVSEERMSEAVAATVRILDELTHSSSKQKFQIG
jgi:histidyl-tRNA synthetase